MRKILLMLFVLCHAASQSAAQNTAQGTSEEIKALAGDWEISNADREKTCNLILKTDPAKGGFRIEFAKNCATVFPATKDVSIWALVKGELRLLNARGRAVFDFTEVEAGMYEAERPAEGLYFLQSQTAQNQDAGLQTGRAIEDLLGDWRIARGGKTICAVTLTNIGAGAEAGYVLRTQSGCDNAALSLQPAGWRLDRGELLLLSAGGQSLRFEESEPGQWRRVPDGAGGLTITRK